MFHSRNRKKGRLRLLSNAVAFAARTLESILELTRGLYRAFIQEQNMGIHYHKEREALDYMLNPEDLTFVDGFVELPWCAGLGVEVNESLVLEENKQPRSWKNPVWAASGRIGRGVVRGLRRKDPDAQQTL